MSNDLAQRLLDLKEQIKEDEKSLIEAQANLKTLIQNMKKQFKVDNLSDAKKLLSQKTKERQNLATKIENAIEDIEAAYEV
jgi:Skp family chaperone for outer membrane proteins